jgi:hypothetical protein
VSTRSAAWYAENLERRQETMRTYVNALTLLGRQHAEERRTAYQRFTAEGHGSARAHCLALAGVRDEHKTEFRKILAELRNP